MCSNSAAVIMNGEKCINDYQFRLKEYRKQAVAQKNSFLNRKQAFFLVTQNDLPKFCFIYYASIYDTYLSINAQGEELWRNEKE